MKNIKLTLLLLLVSTILFSQDSVKHFVAYNSLSGNKVAGSDIKSNLSFGVRGAYKNPVMVFLCVKTSLVILCVLSSINFSSPRYSPCSPPHTTKVQLAPCHNPPISMVSIRLIYVRTFPFRLPPSGIYK